MINSRWFSVDGTFNFDEVMRVWQVMRANQLTIIFHCFRVFQKYFRMTGTWGGKEKSIELH